jgi:hypothetical protein
MANFADLPVEIRLQILRYVLDINDPSISSIRLQITHRSAPSLSLVSRAFSSDIFTLIPEYRRTHSLSFLSLETSDREQEAFDLMRSLLTARTKAARAQSVQLGAEDIAIGTLLDTVQALKARSFEAREGRQFLEAAMRAQRERLRELTQENDRLSLQVAVQAEGLDV